MSTELKLRIIAVILTGVLGLILIWVGDRLIYNSDYFTENIIMCTDCYTGVETGICDKCKKANFSIMEDGKMTKIEDSSIQEEGKWFYWTVWGITDYFLLLVLFILCIIVYGGCENETRRIN